MLTPSPMPNGLSLSSNFIIRFQQIGSGDFNTSFDEDGFMIDDVKVVVPEIEFATLPFEDGFETGIFGPMWNRPDPSQSAIGQPTAPNFAPHLLSGFVDVINDPDQANNGSFYTVMGRGVDGNLTTNALDLRLNLEGQSEVELRFFLRSFF